jgi:hypothetical protein
VLKQLTRFTYALETEEEEGKDDQMRRILTINRVHVQAGDGWEGIIS